MADFRKRVTKKSLPCAGQVLKAAIADCLAQQKPIRRLAVALSGGLDSSTLAIYAASLAREQELELHCFHIHHGLHPLADQWQSRVHDLAQVLGLACHSLRVHVPLHMGLGVEAAARLARYAGLAQLAQHSEISSILLGHHQDDQAETVLLRLLRGSGVEGLAAMQSVSIKDGLRYLRPFLDIDRQILRQAFVDWQSQHGWQAVADPGNTDARYARSALRTQLAPALDARWPAWRRNLARHARLSAQTQEILQEVAMQDFAHLEPSGDRSSFSLVAWRILSAARQALVLRYWLTWHGVQMPTQARLHDLLRQLRQLHALGHDRHMRVHHAGVWVVCERGRVILEKPSKNH